MHANLVYLFLFLSSICDPLSYLVFISLFNLIGNKINALYFSEFFLNNKTTTEKFHRIKFRTKQNQRKQNKNKSHTKTTSSN